MSKIPTISRGVSAAKSAFIKLSGRERLLIAASVSVALFMVTFQTIESAMEAFSAQEIEIARVRTDRDSLTVLLSRFDRLAEKKRAIESRYEQLEIKEGVFSYLERLVKEKANVGPGRYKITSHKERPFGGNFEQVPFTIKFDTASMPDLVAFLTEIVQGEQPLILTSMELSKNLAGSSLSVEVSVSTIRKVA